MQNSTKVMTALTILTLTCSSQGQMAEKKVLTLEGAKKVAAAAEAEAKKHDAGGTIAIVDDGGHLLYLERLEGTFAASATVATGKARTSAMFRKPTKFFEDVVNNGRTTMVALPEFTPLQGGVPIVIEGQVVGAIGVSGAASAQQDEEIAMAGANALAENLTAQAGVENPSPAVPGAKSDRDRKQVVQEQKDPTQE